MVAHATKGKKAIARRADALVVIPPDAVLPALCVRCGRPTTQRIHRTLVWVPVWALPAMLLGMLPYLLLRSTLARRVNVALPLCHDHKRERIQRINVGGFIAIAGLPAAYVAMVILGLGPWVALVVLLVIVAVGAQIAFRAADVLSIARVDERGARLGGACDEFLAALEPGSS